MRETKGGTRNGSWLSHLNPSGIRIRTDTESGIRPFRNTEPNHSAIWHQTIPEYGTELFRNPECINNKYIIMIYIIMIYLSIRDDATDRCDLPGYFYEPGCAAEGAGQNAESCQSAERRRAGRRFAPGGSAKNCVHK